MAVIGKVLRFIARHVYALFPFVYGARALARRGGVLFGPAAYIRDARRYRSLDNRTPFRFALLDSFPYLYDRFEQSGEVPRHYFHQDLWAARKVLRSGVDIHYDFGSRLDGFVAHCLTFCQVRMFDIRPLEEPIEGLDFVKADITDMPEIETGSITSISSLHALEHVGLGRYGDQVDPEGYRKAIAELLRVVRPGGALYIGLPIGKQRLEFNAMRVFDPLHVVECFSGCDLVEFAAVDDKNRFVAEASLDAFRAAQYSCGLFHFVKTGGVSRYGTGAGGNQPAAKP